MRNLLFFRKSIHAKMLLSFMAVSLIPLILLGWVSYTRYSGLVEERTAEYNAKLIRTFTKDMDQFLFQVEQFSYTVYQDNFQALWKDSITADDFQKIRNDLSMNELFQRQEEFYDFRVIRAVTLLDADGSVFYENKKTVKWDYSFAREPWFASIRSDGSSATLMGPYLTQPWLPKNLLKEEPDIDDYSLTYVRKVSELERPQKVLGYIMLHFSLKEVLKFLDPLQMEASGSLLIADRQGNIVYDTDSGEIGKPVAENLRFPPNDDREGFKIIRENNRRYLVTSSALKAAPWDIYSKNDLAKLLSDSRNMRLFTLLFVVVSFGLAILAAQMLSVGLVKPIKRLKNAMVKVSQGYLGVQAGRLSQDEIGELGRYYNEMIGRIKYLIEQVYTAELHEREAKLSALQAQINPHFLYNTLETINSIAAVEGVPKVSAIARALSDMFRYSTKAGGLKVFVFDEIRHIRNYLEIVSIRFEDKLFVRLDIPAELQHYKMIKLVFQPIVENAVFHGIETKRGQGEIRIEARKEKDDLIFVIRDDGMGMAEEQLAAIRKLLADHAPQNQNDGGSGKVGIKNVHDRIRFYYGEAYGIALDSTPGNGTSVTIRIPAELT